MSNHTLETPTERRAGVWTTGPDGELIPDYEGTFPTINEGEVVHGTVVRVDKDEVLVDIGYKSEGVIPVAELSIRRNVNPADEVSVGDEIDALVMTKEDAEGRLILSKKRARFELAWKAIEAAAESGEPVNGRVIEVVKGGLILDLGVRGFLPASLVDIRRVQDLDEFLGKELRCKVIELNRSRNNVVLSRRAVLEDERKEMRQAILDRLNPGDVVEGTISNIVDFGAFVDLEGMDGLIHISELSWSHVNHPSEVLEIGQTVNVKVLDIDRERQRISLGLKQTQSDPWQQVLDHYGEGDVVEGRVTKVVTFGAFVEILPGVEGLVHISELANHHVENPREVVSQGDPVNVLVLEIDGDRRRLSLSLKRVEEGAVPVPRADGGDVRALDARPAALRGGLPVERRASPRTWSRSPAARTSSSRGRSSPSEAERRRSSPRRWPRSRWRPSADADVRAAKPTPRSRQWPRPTPRSSAVGARSTSQWPSRSMRPTSPRRTPSREAEADSEPKASASPDRGRDHGGNRSREVDRARGVPRARCRDGLERRDRPPPPGVRRRRPRRARRAAGGRRSRRRTGARTGAGSPQAVFGDPEQLAWLEGLLHPLVSREYLGWREQLADLDDPPRVCVTEVPLLFEVGAEERFDKVVVVTAPTSAARAASAGAARRPRRPAAPRPREGPSRRLPLRQHGHVRRSLRVGRRGVAQLEAQADAATPCMRRIALASLLAAAAAAGVIAWVLTRPAGVVRAHPLPAPVRGDRPDPCAQLRPRRRPCSPRSSTPRAGSTRRPAPRRARSA